MLYDIAMKLSQKHKICMIHCGEAGKKWEILHERLRQFDFWPDNQKKNAMNLEDYSAILVDEAHLLSTEKLELLLECVKEQPVIFSSDVEDMISPKEIDRSGMHRIEHLPEVQIFRLTNRIRTNAEYLAVVLNDRYYYDEEGYLRSSTQARKEMSDVRKLFHDLNQAKESLALIILGNKEVYGRLLNLLQG